MIEFEDKRSEDLALAYLCKHISAGNILLFKSDFKAYSVLGDYYAYLFNALEPKLAHFCACSVRLLNFSGH